MQAIFALGRLRAADEESIKAIVERLSDQDAQVRRASIRAANDRSSAQNGRPADREVAERRRSDRGDAGSQLDRRRGRRSCSGALPARSRSAKGATGPASL